MLKNRLYTVVSTEQPEENKFFVKIKIDASHEIFKGHFPEQPVLPGVCLIEMTKEILGELKNENYRFTGASNIKYARLVDPTIDDELNFDISLSEAANGLSLNVSSILKDGSVNFKMKGTFAPIK